MDEINIYTPGALSVITAITEEVGIVEVFNEHLDRNESQCTVSPCYRLLAILVNLLRESKTLYQLQQFYQHTDTENLFGEGIQPAHLNDAALVRALDKLAASEDGPKQVLGTALLEVIK